jgi:hypothetical protein
VPVREGVPEQARAAPGEGVAVQAAREEVVPAEPDPEELTDEEIRQLLSEQTVDRWTRWKRKKGLKTKRACSSYNDGQGPAKPQQVFCSPDDVPAEQIELYRENQRKQRSTFLTEPTPEFLTQPTPKF